MVGAHRGPREERVDISEALQRRIEDDVELRRTAAVFGMSGAVADLYLDWADAQGRARETPETYEAFGEEHGADAVALVLIRQLLLSGPLSDRYLKALSGRREVHQLLATLLQAPQWRGASCGEPLRALAGAMEAGWKATEDGEWSDPPWELHDVAKDAFEQWSLETLPPPLSLDALLSEQPPADATFSTRLRTGLPAVVVGSAEVDLAASEIYEEWKAGREGESGVLHRKFAETAGADAAILLLAPTVLQTWVGGEDGLLEWFEREATEGPDRKTRELLTEVIPQSALASTDLGEKLLQHLHAVQALVAALDPEHIRALQAERHALYSSGLEDPSAYEAWQARWSTALGGERIDALDRSFQEADGRNWLDALDVWARSRFWLPGRRRRPPHEAFQRRARLTRLFVQRHARAIQIPVHVIETLQRAAQVRKELRTSLGREASDAELAEALDLSVDKVQKLRLLLPKEDS